MKRPTCPSMDEITGILTDIAQMKEAIPQMEEAIAQLKQRLRATLANMAAELSSETERIEAARYLYWTEGEVPSAAIAEGLLGANIYHLRAMVGTNTAEILCDRCGELVPFSNRTQLQEAVRNLRRAQADGRARYAEGYVVICDACWLSVRQERDKGSEAYHRQFLARLHELRAMRYQEYLRTPEWQSRRAHHLKSAGFRCQVCNAGSVPLEVHHRTYERRGNEYFNDLIALCRPCHDLFHREGRLAEE